MPKRHLGPLVGPRVRLRLLEEADLPLTLAWRNQDHIRRWFVHEAIIAPDAHRRWFEAYRDRDDDFVLVIEETRDAPRPVGQAALYRIDWAGGHAEFGRLMIGEADAVGRGLAREATALLVEHALGPLGLREVELEVFGDNVPAIAIYRACGFVDAGARAGVRRMVRAAGPGRR